MGLIAQRNTTINGIRYSAEDPIVDTEGKPVADEAVGNVATLVRNGVVIRVPNSAIEAIVRDRDYSATAPGEVTEPVYVPVQRPSTSLAYYETEAGEFPDVDPDDAKAREAGMTEVEAPPAPAGVFPREIPSTSMGAYAEDGVPEVDEEDAAPRDPGMSEVEAPRAPEGVTFPRATPSTSLGAIDADDEGNLIIPGPESAPELPREDEPGFDVVGSNIPAVLAYVEQNPETTSEVLAIERSQGRRARATLVKRLEEKEADMSDQTPQVNEDDPIAAGDEGDADHEDGDSSESNQEG